MILATDGDFNVGETTEKGLEDLITRKRQTGVYLTCLGVGMGNFKDSKLETLAKRGNGNYAYLDYSEWLPKQETLQSKLRLPKYIISSDDVSLTTYIDIPTQE